jgi:hypothetical protein
MGMAWVGGNVGRTLVLVYEVVRSSPFVRAPRVINSCPCMSSRSHMSVATDCQHARTEVRR